MLCPKCNAESERRFCERCGLDLAVYQELSALRTELESLRLQLSALALGRAEHSAAPAKFASKESHVAGQGPKPPPRPPGPAPVERIAPARSSTELALG